MKKIFLTIFFIILLLIISLITIISTNGVETTKFNNIISQKIKETNNNVGVKLNTIKFKLDIKQISLFLETKNPTINYRGASIPVKNIKVYIDFFSLIKSKPKIDRINLLLNQLNINELKKISINFKPSNLNSFLNNNVKQGEVNSEIEVFF